MSNSYYAYIPIRNYSKFGKLLRVDGLSQPFLFIPRDLFFVGEYESSDWINRKFAYFYPLDDYYLVSLVSESSKQDSLKEDLWTNVNSIVYQILKQYPNHHLCPHALTPQQIPNQPDEIERNAVSLHHNIFPSGKPKNEVQQALFDYLHPVQQDSAIMYLLRMQNSPLSQMNCEDLIREINKHRYAAWENNVCGILGTLILEYFRHLPKRLSIKHPIRLISSIPSIVSNTKTVLHHIRESLTDCRGQEKRVTGKNNRLYWEFGDFRRIHPRPKIFSKDSLPQDISQQEILRIETKFLSVREREEVISHLNCIFRKIGHGENPDTAWNDLCERRLIETDKLTLDSRKYDSTLLGYYLDACSASRPGLRFINLYQVIEAKIPKKTKSGCNKELDRIKEYLSSVIKNGELNSEIEAAKKITLPIRISGVDTKLAPITDDTNTIATALYKVRCMIAHSKEDEVRITPFSKDEYEIVPMYWDLMAKIAEIVIESEDMPTSPAE